MRQSADIVPGPRTPNFRQRNPCKELKQWNRYEVHACADSFSPQLANELGAVDLESLEIEPKNIEMPSMTAPRIVRWKLHFFHAGQRAMVDAGVKSAAFG